jgi:lactoylglutathione lyase
MSLYEKNSSSYVMVEMKTKFTYTGIRVKDLKESVQFYTQVLGMKETGRSRIEQSKGEVVSLITHEGGPVLELNYYESGSPFDKEYVPGEAMDHLAFQVDDLDKALAEARGAGYPLALEMKTGTSRWAYIKDPNGIFIELFS